ATSVPGGSLHVAAAGTVAYLANPNVVYTGSSPQGGLYVLDFSLPAYPSILANVRVTYDDRAAAPAASPAAAGGLRKLTSLVGSLPTTTGSQGVAVANGYAYLADTSATEIIDVSTPSRPVLVSSIATVNAQSVAVVGTRLYVLDGGVLKIFSVATASAPLQLGTATTYGALSVAVTGSTVFLSAPAVSHVR